SSIMAAWRGTLPEDSWRIHGLYGDHRNLAPITLFTGTDDILYRGARLFRERVEVVNQEARWNQELVRNQECGENQEAIRNQEPVRNQECGENQEESWNQRYGEISENNLNQGKSVRLEYWERLGMFHCWVLIPFPESRAERKRIVEIVRNKE
ncbi:MAG: hypothetical protein Q4C70_12325, partial [Planctomycetia bacterium]|nr:hypothetical protein [Planctomycetia bacterium]